MSDLIGACGLNCGGCPAYLATQAGDAARVAAVAEQWSKEYGGDIKPEGVWCDGCMTAGPRKCAHCGECEIRACVAGRGFENCAPCPDFGCARVADLFRDVPTAREALEKLRPA
jgi:hypothetical protein